MPSTVPQIYLNTGIPTLCRRTQDNEAILKLIWEISAVGSPSIRGTETVTILVIIWIARHQDSYYEMPNSNLVYCPFCFMCYYLIWVRGTVRQKLRFSNFVVVPYESIGIATMIGLCYPASSLPRWFDYLEGYPTAGPFVVTVFFAKHKTIE